MTNKIYTPVLALSLLAGGAQAQQNGSGSPFSNRLQALHKEHVPVQHPQAPGNAQRETIFSEDFANGMAGNNGVGAWTVSGPNGDVWRRTTTGPTGAYSDVSEAITSATASNGFMIFASDSANTDGNGNMIDPPVALTGSLVSPVLDLSANPFVEIRFSHVFRFCCSDNTPGHFVDVSTDGGTTWPNRFNVENGIEDNVDPGTVEFAVPIAAIINGNATNVRFRFTQDGANGITHYHWQVDDIQINTLPGNELNMLYGYTSQFGGGYEYGTVPQSQMPTSINVGGAIFNYGSNVQNNVSLTVSLQDASSNEVATLTLPVGTILAGDTGFPDGMLTLPANMPVGTYTAVFTMTSDSIAEDEMPNNNTVNRYLGVSTDLYCLDAMSVVPSAQQVLSSVGTTSFTNNTVDVRLLNYFEVHTEQTFTGVEIQLSSQAQAGSYFIAAVYDTADLFVGTPLNSPLVESEPRIITQGDLSSGRKPSVAFMDAITLPVGAYYVSANLYKENGKNIYVLDDITVPQPGDASMLWLPVDDENSQFIYGNGNAWAVRLSSSPSVGVQEVANLEGVSLFPSPTNGPLEIRLETPGKTTVEVFNSLGKVVRTASFNGTRTTLDLSGNAAGVYTVRVSDGARYNVQRIALQ